MALPVGAFFVLWLCLYLRPTLVWDGWILADGMIAWGVIPAFEEAFSSLILIIWLFAAGFWLYFNPRSVYNVAFTLLAALPFLFAVLVGFFLVVYPMYIALTS
jgi:hypothetical protein